MSISEISDMFLKTKRSSWDFFNWVDANYNDLDENKIKKIMNMIENNFKIISFNFFISSNFL